MENSRYKKNNDVRYLRAKQEIYEVREREIWKKGHKYEKKWQTFWQNGINVFSDVMIGLLVGSNRRCYGKLLEDLKNNFTQGHDNYPATLQQAYSLLVHWKQDPRNIVCLIGGTNDGIAFTNVGTETSDRGNSNSQTTGSRIEHCCCYNCGEVGHISRDCTQERTKNANISPTQLLIQGVEDLITDDLYQFAQCDGRLPRSWIIIDTGLTVNVFSNKSLLKNVRATSEYAKTMVNPKICVFFIFNNFFT